MSDDFIEAEVEVIEHDRAESISALPAGHVLIDSRNSGGVSFQVPDCGFLAFGPGLNLIDQRTWSMCDGHAGIKRKLDSGALVPINLSDCKGTDICELIARTRSIEALEYLKAVESAKPLLAGPKRRRDPNVVEAVERQLAKRQARHAVAAKRKLASKK